MNYNKEERVKGIEFHPKGDFKEDVKILEELLQILMVDFVLIPDNALGKAGISSLVCAKMLSDALGICVIASIAGRGKSKACVQSLLLGAKYANLKGVACVSGDERLKWGLEGVEVLALAKELGFLYRFCTASQIEKKAEFGATHAITQPIFSPSFSLPSATIPILPSFMPIFSKKTFSQITKNQEILGFEIPKSYSHSPNLLDTNKAIFSQLQDFYLIPLNLKSQMPYFREMLGK